MRNFCAHFGEWDGYNTNVAREFIFIVFSNTPTDAEICKRSTHHRYLTHAHCYRYRLNTISFRHAWFFLGSTVKQNPHSPGRQNPQLLRMVPIEIASMSKIHAVMNDFELTTYFFIL